MLRNRRSKPCSGNINTPSVWIDGTNGQSYYVVTYYDGARVVDPNALAQIPVRVGVSADPITLGSYGAVTRSVGPSPSSATNSSARPTSRCRRRDATSAAPPKSSSRSSKHDPRTRDVRFSWVGQVDLMRTTFSGLGVAIGLAIMVVFMIMAAQFKSLRLPFVMLFTIPVSLVGIDLALMAAGQGFSITALMGILMVVGIAVSNGILLVDDANRRFQEGGDKFEAVIAAARSRFVPIMMTSLATIIGLVPTAFALEHGTESNQPLALAVVGGLTSSTVLSLFLVPVMFLSFAKKEAPADGAVARRREGGARVSPPRFAAVPAVVVRRRSALLATGALMVHRAEARINKVALASSPQPVAVVRATAAMYRASRNYAGTFESWVESGVGPQFLSAYVDTVLVRPGAVVKRGDLLATLDCRNANAHHARRRNAGARHRRRAEGRRRRSHAHPVDARRRLRFSGRGRAERRAKRRAGGAPRGAEGHACSSHTQRRTTASCARPSTERSPRAPSTPGLRTPWHGDRHRGRSVHRAPGGGRARKPTSTFSSRERRCACASTRPAAT